MQQETQFIMMWIFYFKESTQNQWKGLLLLNMC